MINLHTAIFLLNPSIVTIRGDIAYDANEQEVAYDKAAVEAKLAELQAEEIAQKKAENDAKESAIAKLSAIGLTADEIKALTGTA